MEIHETLTMIFVCSSISIGAMSSSTYWAPFAISYRWITTYSFRLLIHNRIVSPTNEHFLNSTIFSLVRDFILFNRFTETRPRAIIVDGDDKRLENGSHMRSPQTKAAQTFRLVFDPFCARDIMKAITLRGFVSGRTDTGFDFRKRVYELRSTSFPITEKDVRESRRMALQFA